MAVPERADVSSTALAAPAPPPPSRSCGAGHGFDGFLATGAKGVVQGLDRLEIRMTAAVNLQTRAKRLFGRGRRPPRDPAQLSVNALCVSAEFMKSLNSSHLPSRSFTMWAKSDSHS